MIVFRFFQCCLFLGWDWFSWRVFFFQCMFSFYFRASFPAVTQVASFPCGNLYSGYFCYLLHCLFLQLSSQSQSAVFRLTLNFGLSLCPCLALWPCYYFSCSLKKTVVPFLLAGSQCFCSLGAIGETDLGSLLHFSWWLHWDDSGRLLWALTSLFRKARWGPELSLKVLVTCLHLSPGALCSGTNPVVSFYSSCNTFAEIQNQSLPSISRCFMYHFRTRFSWFPYQLSSWWARGELLIHRLSGICGYRKGGRMFFPAC